MSDERTNHFLTDEQVAHLKSVIDAAASEGDDNNTYSKFVLELWRTLLGNDCFDDGHHQIDVTMHAIQRSAADELLGYLLASVKECNRAQTGLSYINIGPGTW